jgi:hypothetical protein
MFFWRHREVAGIILVESTRELNGTATQETRFYIGSIGPVENQLHWSLDVAFREDDSRVREPVARENLAVLRHIALNRLKNDPTKLGIQNKRLKAGWDERYLATLLFEDPLPPSKRKTSDSPNISPG